MDTESSKKRRSKKDSEGRQYNCECGKSYLSYQALYTHKRTKHTDTIKLEEGQQKRRGRPKGTRMHRVDYDPCLALGDGPLRTKLQHFDQNVKSEICDDIFVEFLNEKSKLIPRKEFKSLANSVINLRTCVNKHYIELNDSSVESNEKEYTEKNKPMLLPKISNLYVLKFLPNSRQVYDKETEVNFMIDFCEWLTSKNYTDLEISIVS